MNAHVNLHMFRRGSFMTCPIYRIYPKYLDTSTPHHTCSIYYPILCLNIAGYVANDVDSDETPRSAASHLGLRCLLRTV